MSTITRKRKFRSTHNLLFVVDEYRPYIDVRKYLPLDETEHILSNQKRFRVGTVEGLFSSDEDDIYIIAVVNKAMHNGHFTDAMEWFEHLAVTGQKGIVFCDIVNPRFMTYLQKRGYTEWKGYGSDGLCCKIPLRE